MSDCQSFSQKEADAFESRFRSISERFREFHEVNSKISDLQSALDDQVKEHQKTREDLILIKRSLSELIESHDNKIHELNISTIGLTSRSSILFDQVGRHTDSIKSLQASLDISKDSIRILKEDRKSLDDDIRVLIKDVSDLQDSNDDHEENINEHANKFISLTGRVSSNQDNLLASMDDFKKELDKHKQIIEALSDQRKQDTIEIVRRLETKTAEISNRIPQKQEIPNLSTFASKDDLSKINNQLECISLDSQNAVLKSSNSSQQISILEKKIESVLLQLKKIELSK